MEPRVAIPPALEGPAFERRRPELAPITLDGTTMGTGWSVRAVAPAESAPRLHAAIEAVLDRIVAEMSHWDANSTLSRFNRAALGSAQQLPPDFSRVLAAALHVAAASGGAFDPAMGALSDLWGFGPAGPRSEPPTPAAVAAALAASGARHIVHDRLLLSARRAAAVQLDFSGIAKGYAVDAIAEALVQAGVRDFLAEVGGELKGAGIKPDGQPWWVDIETVAGIAAAPLRVALHGIAVATSGDYQRHFEHGGRRYAHTLDPRTGMALDNGVASVTVLHAQCMLADAWATALTVLGPDGFMETAGREGLAAQMLMRGGGPHELISPALQAML